MLFWMIWEAIVRFFRNLKTRFRSTPSSERRQEQVVRVLMFGTSDVGKTTMMRNLILNYGDFDEDFTSRPVRFNETYMQNVIRPLIYQGMINNMNLMTTEARKREMALSSPENEEHASRLLKLQGDNPKFRILTAELVTALRELWADPVLRSVYDNHRKDFKLSGNLFYFVQKLDEVAAPDYTPTPEDLLHTRWPTVGINRYYFVIEGIKFKITDVGGDKNQLTRYRQYVDDFLREERDYINAAKVIIFVASLADYNQAHPDYGVLNGDCIALRENFEPQNCLRAFGITKSSDEQERADSQRSSRSEHTNPRNLQRYTLLDDAQGIFRLIAGREELRDAMLLLFLNKSDFFDIRLRQHRDFGLYFPECQNPEDRDEAVQCVRRYFEQALDGPGQLHSAADLFTLTTCATDQRVMRIIMAMARLHILVRVFGDFIADLPAH